MPNIKFFLKSNGANETIRLRFSKGKEIDYKRSTPFSIDAEDWNQEKQEVRNKAHLKNREFINSNLSKLRSYLIDQFQLDYSSGIIVDSHWLKEAIASFFNQSHNIDKNRFVDFGNYFIKEILPNRKNNYRKGKIGVDERTKEKYRNVLSKVKEYENYTRKKLYIQDINLKFEKEFNMFLISRDRLLPNTAGRLLTFVKTIALAAKKEGVKTHKELEEFKGYKDETKFVVFDESEIELLVQTVFNKDSYLDNARDWLIVGIYTGQRVSDFLRLDRSMINSDMMIEIIQKKTQKQILIPLHPRVQRLLEKRNGAFPRRISEPKFNKYIKEVCQKAKIEIIVEGSKIDPETKRKVVGHFPKHELVTSHICRRTFATIHYGQLPTPIIMNITGHSSEKMFLKYIGKTPKDYALAMKEYWTENYN